MNSRSTPEVLASFRQAMHEAGVPVLDEIIADGRIRRVHVEGHAAGSRNGWYVLHLDRQPAGAFGCWKSGVRQSWTPADPGLHRRFPRPGSPLLPAKLSDSGRAALQADCQATALKRWKRARPADESGHPYLALKGIPACGTRELDGALLIPVCDVSGAMVSLQTIAADGSKRFLKGTAKKGRLHLIGTPTEQILVCEGFATGASLHQATGLAVAVAFDCGNLKPVAEALRDRYPGTRLIICADDDRRTDGNPGLRHALEAARATDGWVATPAFTQDSNGSDFNDMYLNNGPEAVRSRITDASRPKPEALPSLTAELPQGARKTSKADPNSRFMLPEVAPWPTPVDGAKLLDELTSTVRRFVVCDQATANAAALWITLTWLIDAVSVAPIANITAPAPNCGKSTLLDLLELLTRRPLKVDHVSSAALFRVIDQFRPTLLIDEVDTFLKQNEQARGILNSGHKRNGTVLRVVGDNHEPRVFSTWGAKALCGIGSIASTLKSRSIRLELRRKLPEESVERLRYADPGLIQRLQQQLARLALDMHEALQTYCPPPFPALSNRAQDNWEPLLSIADLAGGDWPGKARSTAIAIECQDAANEPADPGIRLLRGIQKAFERLNVDRLPTTDLLAALHADEEGPWGNCNQGKPMTSHQLARQLKEFRITPGSIRVGDLTAKGYYLKKFEDCFRRYLPASSAAAVTPSQPSSGAGSVPFGSRHSATLVTAADSAKASNDGTCDGVTDRRDVSGNYP